LSLHKLKLHLTGQNDVNYPMQPGQGERIVTTTLTCQ